MTKAKKFKLGTKQKIWVKALKSGKFKKAKHDLIYNGGYCCLGVANKVCNLGEMLDKYTVLETTYKKLGLRNPAAELLGDYKFPRGEINYTSLVDMNDGNISHKKIAEFIETNPELVFSHSV